MTNHNRFTQLTIDHVTIAGPELEPLQQAFAAVGLTTEYGGPHSNGITHMALLGFRDGSYIELISSLEPDPPETRFWSAHIAADGGPCAWAAQVDDVAAEADRMRQLGIAVDGPTYYNRHRPDGVLVEWDLAFLGTEGAGAKLPFIIKDITPRSLRVQPSPSVAGAECPLTGVAHVVLAVPDFAESIALFRRLYDWPAPQIAEQPQFGATVAYFADTPVILATPTADTWLTQRLNQFGPSPCAYLLGTDNYTATLRRYPLNATNPWFQRSVAWFDAATLHGTRLGVIG